MVYKTLRAVQETQSIDNKFRCFEVYGFDIMFDADFEPWVLEVNLSPACSERVPFLTKMLDDMAFDLMNWLERKILTSPMPEGEVFSDELKQKRQKYLRRKEFYETHVNLNSEEFYGENDIKHRWVHLPESIEEIKQYNVA